MRSLPIPLFFFFVALAAGPAPADPPGSPGSLDTTFGAGGIAWTEAANYNGATNYMGEIAVQADGKVVAGGARSTGTAYEWVVRRVDASGNLDAGFGTGGLVRLFGGATTDNLYDLDIDPSGRILAVGNRTVTTGKGKKLKSTIYATLVRLNANGSLDTTFGAGGLFQVAAPGATRSYGKALVLEPNGRIVIAGDADSGTGTNPKVFLARCLANGTLDTSFGSGGISVDTRVPDKTPRASAAARQSTGAIVVAQQGGGATWNITRFSANGAVDTAFGMLLAPDWISGIGVDRLDRIVATGKAQVTGSPPSVRVRRYLPDGAADASFGVAGVVTVNSYTQEVAYTNPEFQVDDRIVFGVSVAPGFPLGIYTATTIRLNEDGSLDSTYGTGGHGALIDMGANNWTGGHAMDIAPDGRIVLAGPGGGAYAGQWFFARYDAE